MLKQWRPRETQLPQSFPSYYPLNWTREALEGESINGLKSGLITPRSFVWSSHCRIDNSPTHLKWKRKAVAINVLFKSQCGTRYLNALRPGVVKPWKGYTALMLSMFRALRMSLMPMIFSWWKRSRILISLSVRWQYVWCSNGLIFLMATRWVETLSLAELEREDAERGTKQVSYYTGQSTHNDVIRNWADTWG